MYLINIHSFNLQTKKQKIASSYFIKEAKIFLSNDNFNFINLSIDFFLFKKTGFIKSFESSKMFDPWNGKERDRKPSISSTYSAENNAIEAFELESPLHNHLLPFHAIITMKSNCSSLSISNNSLESTYNFQQRQPLSP